MRNDPMIHAQRSNDPSLTSRLPNSLGVQLRRFALWQQGRNALKPSAVSLVSAALTSMIGATVTALWQQGRNALEAISLSGFLQRSRQ
jgi:hypothetical protein